MSLIVSSKVSIELLQRVPCIRYPVQFQEDQPKFKALINSDGEVNAMTSAFTVKLGLRSRPTNIEAQKIDGSPLETYGMASARFSIQDSLERVWFFEETFLLADTSMKVVLGMLFLSLSNPDIEFAELGKLTWRTYTAAKALPTTSWVELINKREFTRAARDNNLETFVVHVSTLKATTIYSSRAAQIAALQWAKAPTEILAKYSDYADVFSSDLAIELPKNTGLNEHAIELVEGKQRPYGPIYALSPVELETLKTYIKTHLKTGFIQSSKSPVGASICFDKKLDGSLRLYMDYWGLNSLTIKNRYLLPLISEALYCLGRAKQFTQLNCTSAYHWMRIREGDK